MKFSNFNSIQNFFFKFSTVFLLAICILAGLLIRSGSLAYLKDSPSTILLQKAPLITNIDGYYYLNNAKHLLNGTYSSHDKLRTYPEGNSLPSFPPLVSLIIASLSYITSLDIRWIGAVLPPFLALTLWWPIFYICKRLGGIHMGSFAP